MSTLFDARRGQVDLQRISIALTMWVSSTTLAGFADKAGVDRVGVDLERIGKEKRQGGLGTWISHDNEELLADIAKILTRADLFARTNPLNAESAAEIDRLIDLGVKVIMLPMFRSAKEVREFLRIVGGRAKVIPLLENLDAMDSLEALVAIDEIDEIHIGINDLSLSMGLPNRFCVLTTDVLQHISDIVLNADKRLSCGHVGRAMDESLPIPSDLVYAQYVRLGARGTLISKAFLFTGMTETEFNVEIHKLRRRMNFWSKCDPEVMRIAYDKFKVALRKLTEGQNEASSPQSASTIKPHSLIP